MQYHLFFSLVLVLLSFRPLSALSPRCTTVTASKSFERCMALQSQEASIAWSYHPHNASLDIAFFGTFISPSGWVGFGINPTSPEMSGTRALIAFPDPNSGQIVVLPYILDPTVKSQKNPLLSRPLDLHLLSSSAALYGGRMATIHSGATLQIHATLKLLPNKTKIHLAWNRGLYVQGYSPTIHPTTLDDLSSTSTIDFLSGATSSNDNNNNNGIEMLKLVHGVINALAWGLLLPIGAVSARYLRHMKTVGPIWFYVHAGVQVFGVFLGTVGFSIGIRLGQMSPGRVYGVHRKLGIATFCLGWLQTLALLFRPKTTHKFRKYWKSYHHFVGYGCVVLGAVNCFQGFEVMGGAEGEWSYGVLAYSLCLSTLVGVCVALEVNSWVVFCRKAKEEKLKREGLFGDGGGGSSQKESG